MELGKITTLLSGKKKIISMGMGVITGIGILLGADTNTIATVSGAVVALGSVVTYILAEKQIDVARITAAAEALQKAEESINNIDESEE